MPRAMAATIVDVKTAPRLRIGILSDIHLKDTVAVQKLERALRVFRKGRVDGVLICGDLADSGIVSQLEELAGTWEKVFPGSKGIDGGYVERLFHYGDHDNRGYLRKNDSATKEPYSLSDAEYGENLIFKHPKDVWERVFGEPWTPIMHKRVKGYDFILAHFNPAGRNTTPGLKPFLEGLKLDASRPFFYSQHRVLRNTVCGSGVYGQDDGSVGCILSAYPNCCAFCGHSHQTAVREDAIWQGAFTAIQVPSLRYVTHEDGHQNKPNGGLAEQGMLLLVYDDRMVVQRIDFANRRPLAEAWRIPLAGAERPFAHATRRRTAAVPQFEKDARLGAWVEERQSKDGESKRALSIEFPVVNGLSGGIRAYDYEVTIDALCFGGDSQRSVKRVFSPGIQFAPACDAGNVRASFELDEFKSWNALKSRSWGALHVAVRPREVFGGMGAAVEADVQ